MSECSKCTAAVNVPPGYDFDEEVDICHSCALERIAELEQQNAKLRERHQNFLVQLKHWAWGEIPARVAEKLWEKMQQLEAIADLEAHD